MRQYIPSPPLIMHGATRYLSPRPNIKYTTYMRGRVPEIIMRRGAAVGFEKSESSCCFASVQLETKLLSVLSFDVTPVCDETRDWALCLDRPLSPRIKNLPIHTSIQIKEKISAHIKGIDVFFIRDVETLNLLTNVFNIDKSNIYIVKRKLNPTISLFCAPCNLSRYYENCCIDVVICISNLLSNLRPDYIPKDLLIAAAAHPYTFASTVTPFPQSCALLTADVTKCVEFENLYGSEADSYSD